MQRLAGKITVQPHSVRGPPRPPGMVDFCVYFCYRAALALLTALPPRLVFSLGRGFGFIAWFLLPAYRQLARRNVEIAFGPEKSEAEKSRIVRRHFQQLGANLLSGIKLNTMPLENVAALVKTEGAEAVHRELRSGRPVVLVLSHLGNWELFAQILPYHFGYKRLSTVYQKLGSRRLDEFVRQQRARFGVQLFDRSEGFQEAIRLLRGGGMIGILSDQHAGDHGLWAPFFGRLASTSPLPALLCKRTGAALIAASLYTDGPGKWRMTFSSPFDLPEDSVSSLTAKTNEIIAEEIRRAPEDWFWVHNRWKTPQPNFLLQKYKRGLFLPESARDLKPFRILIRASNWLGDSVISIPAVRAIKRGRPDVHVTVFSPEKIAAIWRLVPEVDEVISLGRKSIWQARALIRAAPGFDAGILFPNSLRVALELWLAGVPRRVGYAGHGRRWFLNQVVREKERNGPPPHQAEHYLDLARSLGAEPELEEIAIAPISRAGARSDRIGLCPGAEYGPAKRWLPERFAAVAAAIGGQWVLFGTAKDAAVGAEIAAALGERCLNLIGLTTLEQLIDELGKCRLLLTNDTGTMHLATLLGIPVVAVFGSTEPSLTGPLGTGNRVVRHQVECSPCFLRECPLDFRCMKAVSAEEVVAAIASS
ncbi:MAG TPA: lipopolysaccharide heptosyltransferase II [Chthoniobacterales bacterium]|nr:lipopolysaccharide heptosyltransferase II [Chthoniobacterales bacterium]